MSLVSAIDAAIAFVDDYRVRLNAYHAANPDRKWNDPIPDSYPRFETEHFEQLGRAILIEAEGLSLGDRLPQPDNSPFNPKADPPAFLGQVNLPGCWFIGGSFLPMPTGRWRDALLTLRALGEHAEAGMLALRRQAGRRSNAEGGTPEAPSTATPADAGHDQGGERQGEGEGARSVSPPKPSREKAYRLFQWAMEQHPELKTDRDVYDWLKNHSDSTDELPSYATWSKYLREARAHHHDHKHTPRTTKTASGKNVVRREQI